MSQIPTCFSHFLISYIHCSQFGKRSKWRKRRAAIAIATAKGQTTPSGWNKKSGVVYVLFFPFFWLKTFHCFEMETRGWHCHSYTVPPDSSLSSPWWKGGNCQSLMREGAWWHLYWRASPILSLLRLSFVFIQHSTQPLSLLSVLVCIIVGHLPPPQLN